MHSLTNEGERHKVCGCTQAAAMSRRQVRNLTASVYNLIFNFRDVAQFGSAPRLGRGGRRFKSCHPDFCAKKSVSRLNLRLAHNFNFYAFPMLEIYKLFCTLQFLLSKAKHRSEAKSCHPDFFMEKIGFWVDVMF